jgi:acyl-CoA synthetase (AMP-forming)/AMP-acid ligase II
MSAPTRAYRRLPAASPEEAAAVVARAVTHRPRTIWPWWARPGALLATAFTGPVEWLFATSLRTGRVSAAARALARAGLLHPARLTRAALAARRYGSTLAAAVAAGPRGGLTLVDAAGPVDRTDLDRMADDCARRLAPLAEFGRVGLVGGPDRHFVVAATALGRLGVDTVLLSPDTPTARLPELLAAQGIQALVQDGRYPDPPVPSRTWPPGTAADEPSRSAEPSTAPAGAGWRGRRPGRLVVLTSGSTGAPRAVARGLPLRMLVGPVSTHLRLLPLRPGRPLVLLAPPHHGYGLSYLAAGLTLGIPVLLAAGLTPAQTLDLARRYGAQTLVALPAHLHRLAADTTADDVTGEAADAMAGPVAGEVAGDGGSGLRAIVSGAAPLPVDLHARLVELFGDIVYNLYGTSEAGWAAIATPKDLAANPGTVGRPPRGVRLEIRDPEGARLLPCEVGEVHVTGWLPGGAAVATGDLGHLDPVGRLVLHGRTDDMIVSGGVNVYPQPVAAALAEHPDIAAVRVSAVPDERFGQRLRAEVQVRDGHTLTPEELRAWQRDRLSPAERPRDLDLDPQ